MMEFLVKFWRYPEIRNRLLVTLGALFIYRLGFEIPLPFIDMDELRLHFGNGRGSLITIFALGIYNYIHVLALLMLAARFIPFMRRRMGEGEARRGNIRRLSYVVMLPLLGFHAYSLVDFLSLRFAIASFGGLAHAAIVLSLVAGSYLVFLLARIISLYGITSGIPLLLLGGMLKGLIISVPRSMESIGYIMGAGEAHVTVGLLCIFVVVITVLIQQAYRIMPDSSLEGSDDAEQGDAGGKVMRIKIDYAGVMGLLVAMLVVDLLIMPVIGLYLLVQNDFQINEYLLRKIMHNFAPHTTTYMLLVAAVILPCCHIARMMLFDPKEEFPEPGGSGTAASAVQVAGRIATRVGIIGALGVMAIFLAPKIAIKAYDLKFDVDPMLFFFAAVVALDGMRRLEHLFRARGEDGPLTKLGLKGLADCESWDKRMPW